MRKNKIATLMISALMMISLALIFAAPTVSASDTIYVPDEYDTIQEAIDVASSGDTIIVAAGVYEEEIKIMNKSLTLLGAQADVPIVNGERAGDESIILGKGTKGYPYSWCVVRIQNSNVVINGFIIGNGQRAIAIQGSSIRREGVSDILVSYNYIESSGRDGIFRDSAATNVTITHNYIASNPRGIATNGGGTTITNNTFYGNGKGIDLQGGDPYSVYFPDYTEPKYPTIISGNTFTNDSTSITLRLDKCHQSITITGNDITEARSVAIRTRNVYDVDIVNPAIHYNNIWNNEFGINNQVVGINLDTTMNWWGTTDGNEIFTMVSENVNFSPWLDAPYPEGMTAEERLQEQMSQKDDEIAELQSQIDELQRQMDANTDANTIIRLKGEVASLEDECDELTVERDYWMNQTREVRITSGGGAETEQVASVVVSAIAIIVIMVSLKVIFKRG